MALCCGIRSRVKTVVGMPGEYEMEFGVHQESSLIPILFIIIFEEATKSCRNESLAA